MSSSPAPRPVTPDQLRLAARVASLYHERGLEQSRIASQLGMSQAKVSRLLKQAQQLGIVRITVHMPAGVHADVEAELEQRYGLDEVIAVETSAASRDDEAQLHRELASAVAGSLESLLPNLETVGVSSWSSALLAAIDVMRPVDAGSTRTIVQVLGGLGVNRTQHLATRLTERLAQLTRAEAVFLLAPGVVSSAASMKALRSDPALADVVSRFDELSGLLVGVGAIPPSRLLQDSGNVFPPADLDELTQAGAVGDVCMRFFDEAGHPVRTSLDRRVLGIETRQILRTRRRFGVAGGARKFVAIRAALRGGWLTSLVTDLATARRLCADP